MAGVLRQPAGRGQNEFDPAAGLRRAAANRNSHARSHAAQTVSATAAGANPGHPATPKVATATSRTHTVVAGETAMAITRKFGVKFSALQAANPGVNLSRIHAGQVLNLPAP